MYRSQSCIDNEYRQTFVHQTNKVCTCAPKQYTFPGVDTVVITNMTSEISNHCVCVICVAGNITSWVGNGGNAASNAGGSAGSRAPSPAPSALSQALLRGTYMHHRIVQHANPLPRVTQHSMLRCAGVRKCKWICLGYSDLGAVHVIQQSHQHYWPRCRHCLPKK